MPSTLAEDVVFILFFYSLYTLITTLVPYFYRFFGIDSNNHALILFIWIIIFVLVGVILKDLQNSRYRKELDELDDLFGDGNIGGFDL